MKKVVVDENICISCGFCAGTNDKVFDMGEDSAFTKENENILDHMSEEEQEDVMDIVSGCPVDAIKIIEEN